MYKLNLREENNEAGYYLKRLLKVFKWIFKIKSDLKFHFYIDGSLNYYESDRYN